MFKCKAGCSIYIDCFKAGLRGTTWQEIEAACRLEGINIRTKDYDNYCRGLKESTTNQSTLNPIQIYQQSSSNRFFEIGYEDYELQPFKYMENPIRFFPTDKGGSSPLEGWIWGDHVTDIETAKELSPISMVGENLIYQPFIVLDIDGDHSDIVDRDLLNFASKFKKVTQYWESRPESFHLVFKTDRIIPTMHFNYANIDLLGNQKNQARYVKNKKKYGSRTMMTSEIWNKFKTYILYRKSQS